MRMVWKKNEFIFLLFRDSDTELPGRREDRARRQLVDEMRQWFPYLCEQEKRIINNKTLGLIKLLFNTKDYSFYNSNDGLSLIDMKVYVGPLLLALQRETKTMPFSEIRSRFIADDTNVDCRLHESKGLSVNWNAIFSFMKEKQISCFQKQFACDSSLHYSRLIELIDKCYDEIKLTLISPEAYHDIFRFFGEATIEIGYKAFDIFSECRDGITAWRQALKIHLERYKLDHKFEDELLNTQLYPLLKF